METFHEHPPRRAVARISLDNMMETPESAGGSTWWRRVAHKT